MTTAIMLESELTCPYCGFAKRETMPTDACQFFYECTNCKKLLRPKSGDCCVFCSFGSLRCPAGSTAARMLRIGPSRQSRGSLLRVTSGDREIGVRERVTGAG